MLVTSIFSFLPPCFLSYQFQTFKPHLFCKLQNSLFKDSSEHLLCVSCNWILLAAIFSFVLQLPIYNRIYKRTNGLRAMSSKVTMLSHPFMYIHISQIMGTVFEKIENIVGRVEK